MSNEEGRIDMTRGARMRHIREALGYAGQKDFAEAIGITKSRWNNVENGYPVSEALAATLCSRFPGMSRDYIQDGETRGLTMEMIKLLRLWPSR